MTIVVYTLIKTLKFNPIELSAMIEVFYVFIVAISFPSLLSIWNVTSDAENLTFKFYLIVINLCRYGRVVCIILDGTANQCRTMCSKYPLLILSVKDRSQ